MPKLKVFLSSTSKDLGPFRERVLHALRRSDAFAAVAMEDFGTRDAWPRDFCLQAVRDCDIFVGLLGHLYGFIPEGDSLSMTEQEYVAAAEKPRLMWVMPEDAPVSGKLLKADKNLEKQELFRERVLKERLVEPDWSTPEQLATSVLNALQNQALAMAPSANAAVRRQPGIDLARYADRCLRRWRRVDLSTLANPGALDEDVRPELSQVFIPQNARESRPLMTLPRDYLESQGLSPEDETAREGAQRRWQEAKARPVLEVVAGENARQLVLLGDPGSGKSSLARYVLLQLLEPAAVAAAPLREALGGCLPLLVELRDLLAREASGKCGDIVSYLGYLGSVEGFGFDAAAVEAHLAGEPTLLILDGLDEIFEPARRRAMVEEIVGLCVRFPLARILVTSRIAGFDAHPFEAAGFAVATLADLDDGQVEAFARGWFPLAFPGEADKAAAARDDLLAVLRRRPQLRSIAGNPMLLTIMAIVARHKRLARSRSALYRQALEVLCYAWDYRRGLQLSADSPLANLQAEDTLFMLRRIAWHMQAEGEGLRANAVVLADLRRILQRFFAEEWRFPPPQAGRAVQETVQLLQERSWVLTLRGPDLFGFVHRTFLEYLCALELAERFNARELEIEVLRDDFILPRLDDDAWHEVIRLLMGLLPASQADVLIRAICPSKEEARANGARLGLAWQCIAEVDPKQLNKAAGSCEALLEALYEWIVPREAQPGATAIAESLRALEPGCWPGPVLAQRGLPTHSVQWWPTYGDVSGAPHYEEVFPALCDALLVHEPGAMDVLCARLEPEAGIDPITRAQIARTVGRSFGEQGRARDALLRLATARSIGGIPGNPECDDYRERVRRAATSALADPTPAVREASFADFCRLAGEAPFPEVRLEALSLLCRHFPERAETPGLVRAAVRADPDALVREAAVKWLAQLPQEPEARYQELKSLADEERFPDVRRAALKELATRYRERDGVLQTLRTKAVADESPEVRATAIPLLAQLFSDDDATLDLLHARCVDDPDWSVRLWALSELGSISPRDEEMLTFVRRRLADEDGRVRRLAVELLGGFFSDPVARALIQERAVMDEFADVRRVALYQWARAVLSASDFGLLHAIDPYHRGPDPRKPVSLTRVLKLAPAHGRDEDVRAALERMVDEHGLPLILNWRQDQG